jgi:hypothetical protein
MAVNASAAAPVIMPFVVAPREEAIMLAVECDNASGFAELTLDGSVNGEEYSAVVAAIDEALKRHDKLNLVCVLRQWGAVDWSVWPRDLVFHATHRNWMKHVAIVSDMGWVEPTMRLLAPIYPAEIRCFALAQLDQARAWARTGSITRAAD